MRAGLLSLTLLLQQCNSWTANSNIRRTTQCDYVRKFQRTRRVSMAIDYNDPVVAEEFGKVQAMTYEECEEELQLSGVRTPPTMNEMDVKLMLVELRMRLSGQISGDSAQKEEIPESFSGKFEEALFTKPGFKKLYEILKGRGDYNSMNVAAEYVNDPEVGRARYGSEYKTLLGQIDQALKAEIPVTTPTIEFSGFPANMGEAACKMTLEALGEVVDFSCVESEDLPILTGVATFSDISTAKAAIKQYNGMDMGMGTKLTITPVQ